MTATTAVLREPAPLRLRTRPRSDDRAQSSEPIAVTVVSPPPPQARRSQEEAFVKINDAVNVRKEEEEEATTTSASSSRGRRRRSLRAAPRDRRAVRPAPADAARVVARSLPFLVLLHLAGVPADDRHPRPSSSSSRDDDDDASSSQQQQQRRQQRTEEGRNRPSWHRRRRRPADATLSRLALESDRRGLRGLLERAERSSSRSDDDDLLRAPFWLQDKSDGRCLVPYGGSGFGECGDAALWRVVRRRRRIPRRAGGGGGGGGRRGARERRRIEGRRERERGGQQRDNDDGGGGVGRGTEEEREEEEEEQEEEEERGGFALQLADDPHDLAATDRSSLPSSSRAGRRGGRTRFWGASDGDDEMERRPCLLAEGSTLRMGSCSDEAAWTWHVDRDGVLVRGLTDAEKTKRRRRRRGGRWRIGRANVAAAGGGGDGDEGPTDFECVHKSDSAQATLLPCGGDGSGDNYDGDDRGSRSPVGFSLVRHPSAATENAPAAVEGGDAETPSWEPWTALETTPPVAQKARPRPRGEPVAEGRGSAAVPGGRDDDDPERRRLPASHTRGGNRSSAGAGRRAVPRAAASMLRAGPEPVRRGGGTARGAGKATSASHIREAPVAKDGVSFHNQRMNRATAAGEGGDGRGQTEGFSSTKLQRNKSKLDRKKGQTPIHEERADHKEAKEHHHHHHGHADSNPHRPRKIPVHPYIQSSKDFVWVDPLTSLEYPTDLCRYLGHTKKEAGRHTLMGVGQYYRTAFNIKVYGAALYVAKRDVLADPRFGEYAALSADELRGREDFYDHLMNMPGPGTDAEDSVGGHFDRTLFIKINMQLSTDAMRKSLEADWSLLTDEMKTSIIDSSFQERQADERMRRKIQSKENSSNCSCGQLAPPELAADPSCCARGTELVFTWRKNGDFEIRLDGRVVDVFPRPDIARGIFSEYLNDRPISPDARARFADGFPFLLAPLAQVGGVSSAAPIRPRGGDGVGVGGTSSLGRGPARFLMDAASRGAGAAGDRARDLSRWAADGVAGAASVALDGAAAAARGLGEGLDRRGSELLEGAFALREEGMEMLSHLIKQSAEGGEGAMTLAAVGPASAPVASPFSNGFDAYDDSAVGSMPPNIVPDEIGINIEPTMNFTHRLFFTTVHVYLLLLLVLSLPGGSYRTRFVVVKRRILETKKFVEVQSQGAFAAMTKLHH